MKVLVALKRVRDPDNADKVGVTPNGDAVVEAGLEWKINPFDEYGLEAALRLTEDGRAPKVRRGEILVVTFGPADCDTKLRSALALGADRALRVDAEDDALDGFLVARGLAKLLEEERPDLVIVGKQTVDGENGQVGPLLAELVDWPVAVSAVTVREAPGALLVERDVDGGTVTLRLELPAVLTVDLRIVAPPSVYSLHTPADYHYGDGVRYAPLPAVLAAKKKPLSVRSLGELVGDATPTVRYRRFRSPPPRAPGRFVASANELVELLGTEAKVI